MSKELDPIVAKLQKKYGKTGVIVATDQPDVESYSTGILALDYATGIGGFPRSHVTGVFGPTQLGKSTILGFGGIRSAQADGRLAAYVAMEPGFDPKWAKLNGIDTDRLLVTKPKHGKEAFDHLQELVETQMFGLIVFDSIGALLHESEMELDGNARQGGQANLITYGAKRLVPVLQHIDTSVIVLNQVRQKMNVKAKGTVYEQPGGEGNKHMQIITIQLRAHADGAFTIGTKDDQEEIGRRLVATVVKNKLAQGTGIKAIFDFYSKQVEGEPFGVDYIQDIWNTGQKLGVIERSGAYYTLPTGEKFQGGEKALTFIREDDRAREGVRDAVLKLMRERVTKPKPDLEVVNDD